jgi:hypothetical protein
VVNVVAGVATLTQSHIHSCTQESASAMKHVIPKTYILSYNVTCSQLCYSSLGTTNENMANKTGDLVTSKIKTSYHAKTLQNFSPSHSPGPLPSSHLIYSFIYFVKYSLMMVEFLVNSFSYVKPMSRTHTLQLHDCTSFTTSRNICSRADQVKYLPLFITFQCCCN